jgi:lipopolysaccharide/colanic/teichoic acid biosynthesis glycosyltransferase
MTLHLTDLARDAELDTRIALPVQSAPKATAYRKWVKQSLDTIVILAAGLLVLPIIALMALIVAVDGHNPFYSQQCIGRGGRIFRMWKIRTMVPNAKAKLEGFLEQNPDARLEWDATQKLKNDPRVTRIGRILRKTSLDELPQLFNVVIGDMSLVGPRPMMVEQKALYHGEGYYYVRPGITGLWQVSDRNDCTFHERVLFDDAYNSDLSLKMDVSILIRTVGVVVRGTGY